MSVFLRRFLSDPGNEVLLNIESVNVLDLEPQAAITGVGTGTVVCVGEYENGPFNAVTQVSGSTDFVNTFGELGYRYNGVVGNNPCARGRKADGALAFEYWNGNAFVQLNAKKFSALLCVRVDTSVGSVSMNRQAMVTGAAAFTYNLEPAQVLSLDAGAGYASATFSATAAQTTTSAATIPTLFAGGETITIGYDDKPNFTVTFLASDQTQAAVIARINAYAGFTFVASVTGTTMRFTALQRGTGSQVRVVSSSAGAVLTTLGMAVGTSTGTGNVSNIDAATFTEVKTIVEAAVTGTFVEQDSAGRLRISKVYSAVGDYVTVGPLTTATALGFTAQQSNSNDGVARMRSAAGTYPTTFAGTETMTVQVDDNNPVVVTFAAGAALLPTTIPSTQAEVIQRINQALGYTAAVSTSGTVTTMAGVKNGGRIKVVAVSVPLVTTATGFSALEVVSSAVLTGKVPAGTLLRNAANTNSFVTMADTNVTATAVNGVGGVGAYSTKVRHALDDGTGLSATAGTISVFAAAPDLGSFAVSNLSTLTAALTEAQIDAQYSTAFDATLDISTVARKANIIFSARQSNVVRRKARQNVLTASASGMFGRVTPIRPPLGTTRAVAMSNVAEPGVGAYREERVVYNFPGVNTFVPQVALRGLAGGAGFTADGNVDIGSDGFLASVMSQLPPEEDPGQLTTFTGGVNGLETSPNAQGFIIDDYIALKASGICAPRMDDGTCIFQSGVTSVDPLVHPNLTDINRRRMADFIEDSLAQRGKSFGKRLQTFARRVALANEQVAFLTGLRSKNNPDSQRIDSFSVDRKSGNTPTTQGLGLYRVIIKVRTLPSFKSIVLQSTIGTTVTVDELAA